MMEDENEVVILQVDDHFINFLEKSSIILYIFEVIYKI